MTEKIESAIQFEGGVGATTTAESLNLDIQK